MAVQDPLTEDDLFDIYKEVLDAAASWRNLGLALRVRNSDLDVVSQTYPLSPKECLRGMLGEWLKGRKGTPTWKALWEAVADEAGGNNPTLAAEIARKHGGSITSSTQSQTPPLPTTVHLEQVVTLRDILCIKYKALGSGPVQTLRMDQTLSGDWEKIAVRLGIEHDECKSINMAKLQDPGRCLTEAISCWLNRNGRKTTTWSHFLTALREVGLEKKAEILEDALKHRVM